MKIRLHWKKGRLASLEWFQAWEPLEALKSLWIQCLAARIQSFQIEAWGLPLTPPRPAEEGVGSHWCLEHVASWFPYSEGELRDESLRASLFWWAGFIRASPKLWLKSLKGTLVVELCWKTCDGYYSESWSKLLSSVSPHLFPLYYAQCHCRAFPFLFESVWFPSRRITGFLCSHKYSVLIQPLEIIPNSIFFLLLIYTFMLL